MKLYIDESGNTGSVWVENGKFNYNEQRHFTLGVVIIEDDTDEIALKKKYSKFKELYHVIGEIKGSDLLRKNNNEALNYFIDNIVDDKHFYVCYYDKKFYLSTMIFLGLLGYEFRSKFPIEYYTFVSELTFEDDIFFDVYCKMIKDISKAKINTFLEFLTRYKFKVLSKDSPLVSMAKDILEEDLADKFINDFITFGSYDNRKYVNVINLNSLSEMLLCIKDINNIGNKTLYVYHDEIDGFSNTMNAELKDYIPNLQFCKSTDNEMIQIADNIASISYKVINEMIKVFEKKEQWNEEKEWILTLASKVITKIGADNIKFTMPIQNWAVAMCVKVMFSPEFPKQNRNNIYFNPLYINAIQLIQQQIISNNISVEESINLLKK